MSETGTLSALARNVMWMMMAEGSARVTRIAAALALAYALTPAAFGAAALVMTVAEFMRTPTRNGVLQAIVRADENALGGVIVSATRINWFVHLGLAAAQIAIAYPLAQFMGAPEIALPLIVLSGIFALYPLVFARVALLHRAGRMKPVAGLMAACLSLANIATAVLALLGFGIWSVVIPRLLSAALWVMLARRLHDAPAPHSGPAAGWRAIFGYGQAILGAELLKSARSSLDKIIIGKLLGMEALGIYAFAFNAGLGLSQSLLKGFADAVFPYLCAAGRSGDIRRDARRVMFVSLATAMVLFGAQAALAPVYVPLLFGARWEVAVPVLAVLCLSAITRPLWEVSAQVMRAEGSPATELRWSAALTAAVLLAVTIGTVMDGIMGAALGVLFASAVIETGFALRVFARPQPASGTLNHAA